MKKLIIPIIALMSLATLIVSNNFNKKPEKINNTVETTLIYYYTLRDYNGRIALFVNDNEAPKETFEVFTNTLPEEDASKIKKGIIVKNEAELQKILEEYIS